MSSLHSLIIQIALLVFIAGGLIFAVSYAVQSEPLTFATATSSPQTAAAGAASTTPTDIPSTTPAATTTQSKPAVAEVKKTTVKANNAVSTAASSSYPEVVRIRNPYATPPLSFIDINTMARQALVNILCTSNGSVKPISGSGTIIDPRGIILTNAHVAQYVLLAQSGKINLSCVVRTGSPAQAHWIPNVLYIPSAWLQKHAADITTTHATGTGEFDYALLYITDAMSGAERPSIFPALSIDTREAIGFVEDQVLAASYPAEFLGGASTQSSLYSSASIATIRQLMTFGSESVDVISIGGTIQAQAGSSGGAVVNAWGRLIGVITTTSEGATTGERDLRAITLSYISRNLASQTGLDLEAILKLNPETVSADFSAREAPELTQLLLKQIFRQ